MQASPLRHNSILPLTHYELLSLKFNKFLKRFFLKPLLRSLIPLLLSGGKGSISKPDLVISYKALIAGFIAIDLAYSEGLE